MRSWTVLRDVAPFRGPGPGDVLGSIVGIAFSFSLTDGESRNDRHP
jgi:hypothetical protein